MIHPNRHGLVITVLMLSALGSGLRGAVIQNPDQASDLASLQRAFKQPPEDSKIMMRWWWFGPSVTQAELEREMRAMKEGGIGGFEVQPVYPLEVEGNFPCLSPEFLNDLKFTAG